jgi:hypothetical protein
MNANTATWLDIIPAIPLARGVPIIFPSGTRAIVLKIGTGDRAGGVVVWDNITPPAWRYNRMVTDYSRKRDERPFMSVDLDDPQGFGWAMRYLAGTSGGYDVPMLEMWVRGDVTDADRLDLARALAAVVS